MILAARAAAVAPILEAVDLAIAPGTWTAVLGPNGAGKTTLLRALAGTAALSAGEVRLGDRSIAAIPRREVAQVLAVVPQDVPEAPGYTVAEVVAMGRAPHHRPWARPSKEDEAIVESAMRRCRVDALADRELATLSGGERRRALVAQALAQRPAVLLLDEPAAFLDLPGATALFDLLAEEVTAGMAVVTVVHDLGLALRYAGQALLLAAGRVVAQGAIEDVLAEARLGEAFGVPVARVERDGVVAFALRARDPRGLAS